MNTVHCRESTILFATTQYHSCKRYICISYIKTVQFIIIPCDEALKYFLSERRTLKLAFSYFALCYLRWK